MTPLQLSILLHYHWSPEDYTTDPFPATRKALDVLYAQKFLKMNPPSTSTKETQLYSIDERGTVMVEALCNLPYPEHAWKMPR